MKHLLSFLLLFVVLQWVSGNKHEYVFERVSPKSGFVFDAIHTIIEDCNGIVWFGTINGLYFYNSMEVVKIQFRSKNSEIDQTVDVAKLYRDRNCDIWVCTDKGLFKFSPELNACIQEEFEGLNHSNKKNVESILQVNDTIFIVTINQKLFIYNSINHQLRAYDSEELFASLNVTYLGEGKNNNIIIGTSNGLVFESINSYTEFRLLYSSENNAVTTVWADYDKYYIGFDRNGVHVINRDGKMIKQYNNELKGDKYLSSNRVREIIKRKNGNVWIGTYRGIHIISDNGNQVIRSNEYNGLPHSSIYVFSIDASDGVWIGTWAGGIAYYNDYNYRFQHFSNRPFNNDESNIVITSFSETHDNKMLIASDHAGLYSAKMDGSNIQGVNLESDNIVVSKIKTIYTVNGREFWLGTFDEGMWLYNIVNNSLIKLESSYLRRGVIIPSTTLIDNDLWIGTRGFGLIKHDIIDKSFAKIDLTDPYTGWDAPNWIWKTYADSKKTLWICTDNGLFWKSHGSNTFKKPYAGKSQNVISSTSIYSICEDHLNRMWIGTKGHGIHIYYPQLDSLVQFVDYNLVNNADVYSILLDKNNDVWFATNQGLYMHSIEDSITRRFSFEDGLEGDLYNPNAAFMSSTGNLFFGTPNGYCVINPALIKENPIKPNVFLTKMLINNLPYYSVENVGLDASYLAELKDVSLKHTQNSLTFSFGTNNYIKPSKNKFKYRLTNYQDEWSETNLLKDITFTKIPPGNYTLEVFGSNNDNVWSSKPLSVHIFVKPPIWLEWYAYLFYILVILSLLMVFIWEQRFRVKTKKAILAERFKNEANEIVHKEKLKFFTNISHEFRTPLTLIISPLNNLLLKFQYDQPTVDHLKIIMRNADRLQRLTNQILDFRLLEVGKLKVKLTHSDIVGICKNASDCFEIQIKEKQLNFIFKSSFKNHFLLVDPDMIEKIVYNLFANAIKFSFEKGQIILSIERRELSLKDYENSTFTGNRFAGDALTVKIQDNGSGIDNEMLPTIFDRFTTSQKKSESGTGIGLHICQEYARLNDANIFVNTKLGKGTTFTLNLPITHKLEYKKEKIIIQGQFDADLEVVNNHEESIKADGKKDIVLLAEDNDELRLYLKSFLSGRFKVLTAKNGTQAIEIATEIVPDIIVTDILMPGADGIVVTKNLKNNPKTKHIPIIVLTALSENSYQKQSIMQGADAFLTKPIDSTTLLYQIDNMLNSRELIMKKYEVAKDLQVNALQNNKLSILEKAEMVIEKNMQNPQFDITQLAVELNLSKSTLHRKIKLQANQSISEFIRDVRLKNAIKLLKDTKYNMDEIGFFVGFNSTSYFMRSFKKKYGQTPKEYSKNKE